MAEIDGWTKAARAQKNNSVLLAVAASSKPATGSTAAEAGLSLALEAGVVGAAIGGAILAGSAAMTAIRRFRERKKTFGDRNVNDKVVALFYPDRVDLHDRSSLRKAIGNLRETWPLEKVSFVEDKPQLLIVGGVTWTLNPFTARSFDDALDAAGISLSEN